MSAETLNGVESEIAALQEKINDLEGQRQALQRLSPEMRVAAAIHQKQCHYNHDDQCGWQYESWQKPGYARKQYLGKAQAALRLLSDEALLLDLISVL